MNKIKFMYTFFSFLLFFMINIQAMQSSLGKRKLRNTQLTEEQRAQLDKIHRPTYSAFQQRTIEDLQLNYVDSLIEKAHLKQTVRRCTEELITTNHQLQQTIDQLDHVSKIKKRLTAVALGIFSLTDFQKERLEKAGTFALTTIQQQKLKEYENTKFKDACATLWPTTPENTDLSQSTISNSPFSIGSYSSETGLFDRPYSPFSTESVISSSDEI